MKKQKKSIQISGCSFELLLGYAKKVMGPWPMQLVVPRAVRAAVRMLTMTCRMVFQVSLFFMVMDFLGVNRELIGS